MLLGDPDRLDDTDVDENLDDVDDDVLDERGEADDWLDAKLAGTVVPGGRRHALPEPSAAVRLPATTSPGVRQLVTRTWAPGGSAEVVSLLSASVAPRTYRKYESDWALFSDWAEDHGYPSPVDVDDRGVAEYVAALVAQHRSIATIKGRLAAIAFATSTVHGRSPTHTPLVRRVVAGAERTVGTGRDQAAPLSLAAMREIVRRLPIVTTRRRHGDDDVAMRRDQLLVGLGWAGALRPSNLVDLDVDDLEFVGDPARGTGGVLIHLGRSKVDQTAAGSWIAVPYASEVISCPVRLALRHTRRLQRGPLFRNVSKAGAEGGRLHPDTVSRRLRHAVKVALRIDPAAFNARSLRAGFVTEALDRGVDERLVAAHTQHVVAGTAKGLGSLGIYDRPTNLLKPERSPFTGWW